MTAPRLLAFSTGCWVFLAALVAAGAGALVLGAMALAGGAVGTVGVAIGRPRLVLTAALIGMGTAVVAAGLGASTGSVIATAVALWLAVESGWRAIDLVGLAPATTSTTTPAYLPSRSLLSPIDEIWILTQGAITAGLVAAGLVLALVLDQIPDQGLEAWMGAAAVVLIAAGAAALGMFRSRERGPAAPVHGPGSSGRRRRSGPGLRD